MTATGPGPQVFTPRDATKAPPMAGDSALAGRPAPVAPLVVGLDLSLTKTGVAHARDGQIVTDTICGRGTGVVRLRQIASEVREHCRTADLVVIEAPNYHMGKNAGYHERAGLHWMVLERLRLDGRTWVEARTSVIRTYATGKGAHPGLGKGPMVEATTRRYPDVQTGGDDNQCDALWLAALGLDHLTGAHVVPESHRRVLGSVEWPTRLMTPSPRSSRRSPRSRGGGRWPQRQHCGPGTHGRPTSRTTQAGDSQFIAANDPAHVLAVLDAAEATLRQHGQWGPPGNWRAYYCIGDHPRDRDGHPDADWPCPDAAGLLDIYAPEAAR